MYKYMWLKNKIPTLSYVKVVRVCKNHTGRMYLHLGKTGCFDFFIYKVILILSCKGQPQKNSNEPGAYSIYHPSDMGG
jgi:hypothetical protein